MTDRDQDKGAARADLCRFLSACYYEPTPLFAEEKLFDSMLAAAQRIDPALVAEARALGETFLAEPLDALLIDYTRLFLGPPQALARPYASIWLSPEGGIMQDSTMGVLQFYREGGFEIDEEFRELPDHIAVELEFLYLLLFEESRCAENGGRAAAAEAAQLRRRFLHQHLALWIRPFTAAVRASAATAFYRALADLTEAFVSREIGATPRG